MVEIKLKLKKLPRSIKVKRWCLEDLRSKKGLFQEEILEEELAEYSKGDNGSIESEGITLREAINRWSQKVFDF